MAKRIYRARKITQSAAVVKLRTYVDNTIFSVSITSHCDPATLQSYTEYCLRIGSEYHGFVVVSRESFDDAFYKLDQQLEQVGLVKGEI